MVLRNPINGASPFSQKSIHLMICVFKFIHSIKNTQKKLFGDILVNQHSRPIDTIHKFKRKYQLMSVYVFNELYPLEHYKIIINYKCRTAANIKKDIKWCKYIFNVYITRQWRPQNDRCRAAGPIILISINR